MRKLKKTITGEYSVRLLYLYTKNLFSNLKKSLGRKRLFYKQQIISPVKLLESNFKNALANVKIKALIAIVKSTL